MMQGMMNIKERGLLDFARIIRRGMLAVCGIVIGILLIELTLRTCCPLYEADDPSMFVYDSALGYTFKSNVHKVKITDYRMEDFINDLGTRNYQNAFRQYKQMVFAVGDSFTEGTGVPMDASYPFQMDMILNQLDDHYLPQYAVINLGTSGYGCKQNLIKLERFAEKLRKPDYVCYLGADNDFQDDLLLTSGLRKKNLIDQSPYWGVMAAPLQLFAYDTQIGLRIKYWYADRKRSQARQSDSRSDATFVTQSLDSVLKQASGYQARLIVGWANDSPLYETAQKWSSDHHVYFANWLPRVKDTNKRLPALPITNDHSGGHYRSWVYRIIAEEFAKGVTNAPSASN